jgi:hypothetical protein
MQDSCKVWGCMGGGGEEEEGDAEWLQSGFEVHEYFCKGVGCGLNSCGSRQGPAMGSW